MDRVYLLRVGICQCTKAYHGKLNGKKFTLDQITEYRYFSYHHFVDLEEPMIFVLEEVSIPEKSHHTPLKRARCHFFLDVNFQARGTPETVLSQHFIIQVGRQERYEFSSVYDTGAKVYRRKKPPYPHEIIAGMQDILRFMDKKGLERWRDVMAVSKP